MKKNNVDGKIAKSPKKITSMEYAITRNVKKYYKNFEPLSLSKLQIYMSDRIVLIWFHTNLLPQFSSKSQILPVSLPNSSLRIDSHLSCSSQKIITQIISEFFQVPISLQYSPLLLFPDDQLHRIKSPRPPQCPPVTLQPTGTPATTN